MGATIGFLGDLQRGLFFFEAESCPASFTAEGGIIVDIAFLSAGCLSVDKPWGLRELLFERPLDSSIVDMFWATECGEWCLLMLMLIDCIPASSMFAILGKGLC